MRRRRSGMWAWINQFFQQGEQQLIRIIVLGSAVLVIMQFALVRDPVQFYLAMSQETESPYIDLNTSQQTATLPASSQQAVPPRLSFIKLRLRQHPIYLFGCSKMVKS